MWKKRRGGLLDLAARSTSSRTVRAGLLGHAARAWMNMEAYTQALTALNRAIDLHDRNIEFFFDRALCHAALKNYWTAIDDLKCGSRHTTTIHRRIGVER